MMPRFLSVTLTSLAVALFVVVPVLAADKTHEGKVVSVTEGKDGGDGKLVMTDNDDKKEHSHKIPLTVKISLNGKTAKFGELKKGDSITVTTDENGNVTEVHAKRK